MHERLPYLEDSRSVDTPVRMSFRSDPLPSYEDIISGKFLIKKAAATVPFINENKEESQSREQDCGNFKYKNVNKISVENVEDGEIPEEGEFEEGEILVENTSKKGANIAVNKSAKPNNKAIKETRSQKNHPKDTNQTDYRNDKRATIDTPSEYQKKPKTDKNFTSNIQSQSPKTNTPFVPRLICRYFMEGICTKADKCTFSHSAIPNKTPEEARVKDPCKFFIAGSCMKGESCFFSHDLSVVPCKFFHLKGECSAAATTRGGGCRFSHAPIDKETLEKLKASENERAKEKAKDQYLVNISHSNTNTQTNSNTNTNIARSSTNHEHAYQGKETETSTNGPHYTDLLLNPFACDNGDEEY